MSNLRNAIKRRKLRRGRYHTAAALTIIFGVLTIWQAAAFYRHFMPIAVRLAQSEANYMVSSVINNAIAARLADGELEYSDIIILEKDENGAVAAIMTDSVKVNRLKTEITTDVINAFAGSVSAKINIPAGNLTGIKLLSGKGPDIPVELVAAPQTDTEFVNKFYSTGINQTCHRIIVRVNAVVDLMLPGKTVATNISAEVAVAETVIIGDVPESYTFFEADENWDENLERFDITS